MAHTTMSAQPYATALRPRSSLFPLSCRARSLVSVLVFCACWLLFETSIVLAQGTDYTTDRSFGIEIEATTDINIADFDADGDLDVLVANYDYPNRIYINDANRFDRFVDIDNGVSTQTRAVDVGDINGDGIPDIVAANENQPNTVYIVANHMDFAVNRFEFGHETDQTWGIALGDVNGDGYLDAVAANVDAENHVYLRSPGLPPYFRGEVECSDADSNLVTCFGGVKKSVDVVLGRFKSDRSVGPLDIAVANAGDLNEIYDNDGIGNFTLRQVLNAPAIGTSHHRYGDKLAIVDLNMDGWIDLVVGKDSKHYEANGLDRSAQNPSPSLIYLNRNGTFSEEMPACAQKITGRNEADANIRCFGSIPFRNGGSNREIYDSMADVTVADIDGDGDPDIVTGNRWEQNLVYLNDGAANFRYTVFDGSSAQPDAEPNCNDERLVCFGENSTSTWAVAAGDLSADGNQEIIGGNGALDQARGGGIQNTIHIPNGIRRLHDSALITLTDMTQISCNRPTAALCIGNESENGGTHRVAVADLNGDGNLDIVTGNYRFTIQRSGMNSERNAAQTNFIHWQQPNLFEEGYVASAIGSTPDKTMALAIADLNNDDILDIIVGNFDYIDGVGQQNYIYYGRAENRQDYSVPTPFGSGTDRTNDIAVGDINGDGYLDIVVVNHREQDLVFVNQGADASNDQRFAAGEPIDCTQINRYRCFGPTDLPSKAVALGDMDADGDLDIAVAAYDMRQRLGSRNLVYYNGGGDFQRLLEWKDDSRQCAIDQEYDCFGTGTDKSADIAVADMNGDEWLDIIIANDEGETNVVYLNHAPGFVPVESVNCDIDPSVKCFGSDAGWLVSIAVGDIEGDGDMDIVGGNRQVRAGNAIFLNDRNTGFKAGAFTRYGTTHDNTWDVALADMDNDGDLDVVSANPETEDPYLESGERFSRPQTVIFFNRHANEYAANKPPRVVISKPVSTDDAALLSSGQPITRTIVPVSFRLVDQEADPVSRIDFHYSMDRGGSWRPAIDDRTGHPYAFNLATSPTGIEHEFQWNLFESGFFGKSQDVVLRAVVHTQPGPTTRPHREAHAPQQPTVGTVTFPFPVYGTSVSVSNQDGAPVRRALVFRNGLPLGGLETPLRTDANGNLPGRGEIFAGDRLVALGPQTIPATVTAWITTTHAVSEIQSVPTATVRLFEESFQAFSSNGEPTDPRMPDGSFGSLVAQPGVQELITTDERPLLLFNLDISLEWDARNDQSYLSQLERDLLRSSELLYDWSNGQIALGKLRVYQNKENWDVAHVRIYASNTLRPSAAQGGIISGTITTTVNMDGEPHPVVYSTGQVRIGSLWNRYGEASESLRDDWARAFAHELGHYLLFLDDNYLGINDEGILVAIDSCPGAMANPYSPQDSEFHPGGDEWNNDCRDTLSNRSTGQADWETIAFFYPWVQRAEVPYIDQNPGPTNVPLTLTTVEHAGSDDVETESGSPVYYMDPEGELLPSRTARSFLVNKARLLDLGSPIADQVIAHGATPGDAICVVDRVTNQGGCQTVSPQTDQIRLIDLEEWLLDVRITPITTNTLEISIETLTESSIKEIRAYWSNEPVSILAEGGVQDRAWTGRITVPQGVYEGTLLIQPVDEVTPPQLASFTLAGNPAVNPAHRRGRAAHRRGRAAHRRGRSAPILSADGQAILFLDQDKLDPDENWNIVMHTTYAMPDAPPWATVVGDAYRISATTDLTQFGDSSISFQYLGDQVPAGQEHFLRIYYRPLSPDACKGLNLPNANCWELLETQLNAEYNVASAPMVGAGYYVLMATIEVPLTNLAWNNFSYPVENRQAISTALLSLQPDWYSIVWCYDPTRNGCDSNRSDGSSETWVAYHPSVPATLSDLRIMEFPRAYWIYITAQEPITLYLGGEPQPERMTLDMENERPTPPAIFFGDLQPENDVLLSEDIQIGAYVNGSHCGNGSVRQRHDGSFWYTIRVTAAAEADGRCGQPGASVEFTINPYLIAVDEQESGPAFWNNTSFNHVNLQIMIEPNLEKEIFLPIAGK